jgi:3-oxoacyl-[acyl-carrier-protein] synthase II
MQNTLPPTLNLHNIDQGFNCNYVPLSAQQKDVNVSISNSFGFGGTNASLAFSKYKQ